MQAIQQTAYGDPPDVIELLEVEEPVPGPGEVVVEVEAAAMHLADLKLINGDPGFRWYEMPRWPGHEGIGHVTALGDDVDGLVVGDRVFLPIGIGAFRQRVAAPAEACTPAPAGDRLQLALTAVNGTTARILLEEISRPAPGEWIVQNGANSSCGRFLIALASMRGARTANIVRRPELVDELTALGADAVVVDSGDPDATAARVREATGGADIRFGFDCVAATGTVTIARCLTKGGTVINYGFMTGRHAEMAFQDMHGRDISLEGMSQRTVAASWGRKEVLTQLAAMTTDGTLKAKIAGTFGLEQIQEALALQARTGTARDGKIIILPNG